MALTGTFLADFSSFYDAAQQADVHLRSMESGAGNVEKSLNKMVDSFSGRKMAQDATIMVEAVERLGGAASLTDAEAAKVNRTLTETLAKYKALGQEAPADLVNLHAQTTALDKATKDVSKSTTDWKGALTSAAGALGLAFSAQTVINFTKELFTAADAVQRISDRTGMTIEDVQRLAYVADQSGNNIDELTSSIGAMQVRLSDPKAQARIKELGIDFAALSAASPFEQLRMVADAISALPTPTQQADAAMDLFGKNGIAILPTLKSKVSELAAEVKVASAAQIAALDAAGDRWSAWQTQTKNAITSYIGNTLLLADAEKKLSSAQRQFIYDTTKNFDEYQAAMIRAAQGAKDINLALATSADPMAAYKTHVRELAHETTTLTAEQERWVRQGLAVKDSHAEIAAGVGVTVAAVDKYAESQKKANDEAEKAATLQAHLFGKDVIAKAAEYATALGGVENVSKLTKAAQAELNKVMSDALEALSKAGQGATATAGTYDKLRLATTDWAKVGSDLTKAVGAQSDAFWAKRQSQHLQEITSQVEIQQAATDSAGKYAQLAADATKSADEVNAAMLAAMAEVDRAMGRIPKAAQDGATGANAALGSIPPEANKAAAAAEKVATAFSWIGNNATTAAGKVAEVWAAQNQSANYAKNTFVGLGNIGGTEQYLAQVRRNAGLSIGPMDTNSAYPNFSQGGAGDFGAGTLAMLHGKEAIVPLDKVGGAGIGGVNAAVTININGHLDPARAGRDAAEALVSYLKSRGTRI